MSDLLRLFRKLAQANRLANARLHRACAALDPAELTVPRPAFFGTIQKTLNHILMVWMRLPVARLTARGWTRPASAPTLLPWSTGRRKATLT